MLLYGTLRDRLQSVNPRTKTHNQEQVVSVEEKKAIVRFFVTLDNLGHPLRGSLVKAFAMSLLPPARQRQLTEYWLTRFLNRNTTLASNPSQLLDYQRANTNDLAILLEFFYKVFTLCYILLLEYCVHQLGNHSAGPTPIQRTFTTWIRRGSC